MEMILLKKQKRLQVPSIIASVMVIMTLLISVGYSAFNTKLNVKDIKAVVRVEKDVRVTNVTAQGNNGGISNWEDYNVSNISGSVRLPNANSTVTYKVEITNIGNVEVGIFKYIAEVLPADLTYATIFPEKSKICDNLSTIKCTMGAKRTIDIVIKYKDGKYNAATATKDYTFNLGFDFRTYHKITYKNITSASFTNLPTEILDEDTLNIDIGTGYTVFNITQGGKALTSSQYTYQNGQFTIQNVTGDLVIEGLKPKSLYATIKDGATSDSKIDFTKPSSSTNGQGKYKFSSTSSDKYPIYYYRGDNTLNNNVLFANFCWKIVRTTDTGGIKIVYSGKPVNGVCSAISSIGNTEYDKDEDANFYGGEMLNGFSTPFLDIHNYIDNWYSQNMTKYTLKLEDTIWNEFIYDPDSQSADTRISNGKPYLGYGTAPITMYSLAGEWNSDLVTLKITYPVALLTSDEAMLAGISANLSPTSSYLPYTSGNPMWLFTMKLAEENINNEFYRYVINNGKFDSKRLKETASVNPSVSLKNDVTYTYGDGSINNPYKID